MFYTQDWNYICLIRNIELHVKNIFFGIFDMTDFCKCVDIIGLAYRR